MQKLVLISFLAISGCDSGSSSPTSAEALPPPPVVIASSTEIIHEDQWLKIPVELKADTRINLNVALKDGPAVDAYFLDEQGINAWEAKLKKYQGSDFAYLTKLSMPALSSSYSSEHVISAGRYALIIDNTDNGHVYPPMNMADDSALVQYKIIVQALPTP